LIRMRHVFERFSMEDGLTVLERCSELLNDDAYILITVPDLRIFVDLYYSRSLHTMPGFKEWALTRIPAKAPKVFTSPFFTHSVPHQQCLWRYDEEDLRFQLDRTEKFKNIQRLSLVNPLSNIPFTHNRPHEDLCILAESVMQQAVRYPSILPSRFSYRMKFLFKSLLHKS
jgi:predicted SAM-dependent methyltransferase